MKVSPRQRRALLAVGSVVGLVAAAAVSRPNTVVFGLILGSINALLAVGIVLTYRTSRIINFAHAEVGGVAGALTVTLVVQGTNYLLAVVLGLVAAAFLGAFIEFAVVRRFAASPRIVLTVATIALAQVLVWASLLVPTLFRQRPRPGQFVTPLTDRSVTVAGVVVNGNHIAVFAFTAVAVAGLTLFLNRTRYGIGVRASAEQGERAALCGIPVRRLSTLMWLVAGVLSAAAFILSTPVLGLKVGAVVGPGMLLRGLAAAVIGRMSSLPVTVGAALALGVLETVVFARTATASVVDAVLLGVVLVALLTQRRSAARVDAADASTWQAVAIVRPVPAELARLPEVRWGRYGVLLGVVAAAVVIPLTFTESRQSLASVIAIHAVVAVSLVVLTGWAGQISLGQFAFVGIGAAAAGTVSTEAGGDFVLSLAAGAVAGAVAAIFLGLPALRLRGFFLAVTTLAFAVATSTFVLSLDWVVPDGLVARPILFGYVDLGVERNYYLFCVAVLTLTILGLQGVRRGRMGRVIVAVRDNERAAQSFGANAVVAKLTAFALSGAIAGLAGGLFVHQQYRFQPPQYQEVESLQAFAMAAIGGLGSIPGAVLGAVFVKGVEHLVHGPAAILATGLGLLVILLVLPKGLGSVVFAARDAVLRRIALRRRLHVPSLVADGLATSTPPPERTFDEAPAVPAGLGARAVG